MLNDKRLAWLPQVPQTRYSLRGVIAIDHTLMRHEGQLIEDVGWFWAHADQRYVLAHDYVISHSVWPSGVHSPIAPKTSRVPLQSRTLCRLRLESRRRELSY